MIETQSDLKIVALLMIYHVLRISFWNKLDQVVMSWHTAIQRHIEPAPITAGELSDVK
jgi:hypothetical protein